MVIVCGIYIEVVTSIILLNVITFSNVNVWLSFAVQCLLALSSVLGGASALLLLAVPVGRITVTFPPLTELMTTCNNTGLRLRHMNDYPCLPLHPYSYDLNLS